MLCAMKFPIFKQMCPFEEIFARFVSTIRFASIFITFCHRFSSVFKRAFPSFLFADQNVKCSFYSSQQLYYELSLS